MTPVTFLHLTDLHLLPSEAEAAKGDTAPSARLRALLKAAPAMDPAPSFALISGDLTEKGDAQSYGVLKEVLEDAPFPVLLALGNHDARAPFRAMVLGERGGEAAYHHTAVIDGLHIITLDTLVPGVSGGALDEHALAFLADARTRHPDLPHLLMIHHPPRAAAPGASPWDSLNDASTAALAPHVAGLTAILAGHIHHDRLRMFHGVPVVANVGLSTAITPTDRTTLHVTEGAGFALCTVTASGIDVAFASLAPARAPIAEVPTARLKGA